MKNSYFLSQPHQPFFVLAFTNAIVSIIAFMLFFKGVVMGEIPSSYYHAYSLFFLMFTPAFLAFLFTTFPRFLGTPVVEKIVYITILIPFTLGSFLFLVGSFSFSIISSIGMVITFIGHLLAVNILRKIYNASTLDDKHDTFWILSAMSAGVVAHLLFLMAYFMGDGSILRLAEQVGVYLYLFFVTFTVAQRMVPFFSNSMAEKDMHLLKKVGLLLVLHVVLETLLPHSSFFADFALVYVVGQELIKWDFAFPDANPLLWIMHLALFWVPTAFLLSGLTNVIALATGVNFLFLDIHTLVLGFVLTMLIGFGTRVTLGHSGNPLYADRWTVILFYWTQIVVISRIVMSIIVAFGWNFISWFDMTVTAWVVLFGIWAIRYFPVLIFGRRVGEK